MGAETKGRAIQREIERGRIVLEISSEGEGMIRKWPEMLHLLHELKISKQP